MIVVLAAAALADVFVFLVCEHRHGVVRFPKCGVVQSAKKTDVAEHPQVFRHVGLLFNEPPGAAKLLFI
jgi:hypothetical protein